MQSEKHFNVAVLGYISLLLIVVIGNIKRGGNILDIIYIVVLVSCVLKFLMVVRNSRK